MRKSPFSWLFLAGLSLFVLTLSTGCKQSSETASEELDEYDGPEQAIAFEIERTKDPVTGQVPWDQFLAAKLETEQARAAARQSNRVAALNWIERGPDGDINGPQGNSRPNADQTAGRIRAAMVDSLDPTHKTVWVGGVDGGLWKTTDITASPANWMPVNDFLSNLAIAAICQDPRPGFQNIMYFCTGESFGNADAVQGVGVFKSVDGGNTWNFLPSTAAYTAGTRIVCDYQGNVYFGARTSGLLRSTDGGATWINITPSGLSSNSVCDLEISSTSGPGRLHVAFGIFSASAYRFTDIPSTVSGGAGWNASTTPYTSFNQRTELAILGNTLYALPDNASHQVPTIWKSTDGGDNWTATTGQPTSGWASGQGWYSLSAVINPTDPDQCIVGGLDCYKTTNGGATWTKISIWAGTIGQYVHADQHNAQWWDGGSKLMFTCDGGVHFSSNGGTTIRDRNKGLRLKQFYSIAVHPQQTNYFLAGAQDNGVHRLDHPGMDSSVEVTGGDGMFVAIDQDEPQYQFGSYVYNVYRRSTNNGASWSTPVNNQSTGRFVNPWDYDNAGNIVYACNAAGNFLRWSNPQTGNTTAVVTATGMTGNVSAVHVSPYTANRVYFGTGSATLYRVDDANTGTTVTATPITPSGATGYVSCVVTGSSDQNLLVCFSNYNVMNVWVSNDGGTTWTGIDGNLPNMPVRWALFHPDTDTKAFIATETGVWETDLINGSSTVWNANPTFPNVRTDMIKYRPSDRTIAAGTHGRGIFTAAVAAPSGFSFATPAPAVVSCPAPTSMAISLGTISNGGFSNPITLSAIAGVPSGTFVSFSPNPVSPGASSTITLNNTQTLAPGSYTITIQGTASGATNQNRDITFTINPGAAPVITSQPAPQTVCAGANASFTVATSAGSPAFQWQLSTDGGGTWNNISGANAATLNLAVVTGSMNGNQYRCIVSTQCGSATSNAALLTVGTTPVITSQPQDASICGAGSTQLCVVASGASLSYQWESSTSCAGPWTNVAGGTSSCLTVNPASTTSYRCRVSSSICGTSVTSNCATVSILTAISITGQPADQTVCEGSNASFTVTASGASAYQWQVSTDGGATWNPVSGATTATYTISSVSASLTGNRYRCVVTGACGSVTSNSVLLTVNTLPSITAQPQSVTLCAGSNNTFSVSATGTGIAYQWQQSTSGCSGPWTNIPGATAASYTLNGITAGMNNSGYRCVVSGTCTPAANSACALLTVVTSVTVTTQPSDVTVCAGANASFTVAGSGSGILYQWQLSTDGGATWNNIAGANAATYTVSNAPVSANGYRYRCLLSNGTCTVPGISNAAVLTVNSLPAISASPVDATVCTGGGNTFGVTASGTGISYQWQLSTDAGATWNNIAGANASTYAIPAATAGMNGYRYRCIVTGTCTPSATSGTALLTVISPPVIGAQPSNAEVCSGNNTSFTVSGTSAQTIVYQWQLSTDAGATWANINGANSATLSLNGVTVAMNNNRYRCQFTNATCSSPVSSNAAVLTVRQNPSVGLSAVPLTSLLPGQTTTLTASPSGSTGGTMTISWTYNNNSLSVSGNSYVVNVEKLGSYQVRTQEAWPGGLVCSALSPVVTIDAPASNKLFIFPSPNDGRFTVSYYNNGGTSTTRSITVYDSKGAQVYFAKFSINGPYTLLNVDLRPAQKGIYYVVVGNAAGQRLAEGKVMVNQ